MVDDIEDEGPDAADLRETLALTDGHLFESFAKHVHPTEWVLARTCRHTAQPLHGTPLC
jgi:hypothetical protein